MPQLFPAKASALSSSALRGPARGSAALANEEQPPSLFGLADSGPPPVPTADVGFGPTVPWFDPYASRGGTCGASLPPPPPPPTVVVVEIPMPGFGAVPGVLRQYAPRPPALASYAPAGQVFVAPKAPEGPSAALVVGWLAVGGVAAYLLYRTVTMRPGR